MTTLPQMSSSLASTPFLHALNQNRAQEIYAATYPHRAGMRTEQGVRSLVFYKQSTHGDCDQISRVATCDLFGGLFNEGHDVGASDSDDTRCAVPDCGGASSILS